MSTREVLADDQVPIRSGFTALVNSADDLEVVGEASDGRAGGGPGPLHPRRRGGDGRALPGTDGIEATRAICADEDLAGVC